MRYDPWHALATDWPGVEVHVRVLPDAWGHTIWQDGTPHIEIAHDLGAVQQRCVLTHEVGHLVHGAPCVSRCDRNEEQVKDWTARRLIPDVLRLAELLARMDIAGVAARLGVTIEVVADRLGRLTEQEREVMAGTLPTGETRGQVAAHPGPRSTARTIECRRKQ